MNYEKLGAFYLGRAVDPTTGAVDRTPILYDAKDLTTHAVCVGMTGSGKTGLGITLLEEAAIDGIPTIAIDPKGDLGNMLLTFPELRPEDFRPWIDEAEALRRGRSPDEEAKAAAELWRKGLAEWDQAPSRISRFINAIDRAIYTPGSKAGFPLNLLRSFAAPSPAVAGDDEARQERVAGAVSGLLSLLGVDADPIRSREHILLSTLVDRAWREGKDLDLPALIRMIQKPPIERIGVMDLDSVFPAADRFALAMTLNNVMAAPGFAAWSEGEPLDVGRLLYTPEGRPRLSVISIAHLADTERMFLVTTLLNEVVSWVRGQPGTATLRAVLYMDEVFGYFPPTADPPSKRPMLTLLKQARAYGLGIVLATQNPVDLDYKGLANAGTWLLGRLQTERDKARIMDGLEGASATAAAHFDRGHMERLLAGLGSRVFLMNNVHDDEPVLFQTRWALSYLRGPLTRNHIRALVGSDHEPAATPEPATTPAPAAPAAPVQEDERNAERPLLPTGIEERFLAATRPGGSGTRMLYRPALVGLATLHYANARANVDEWQTVTLLSRLTEDTAHAPWDDAQVRRGDPPELHRDAEPGVAFGMLPAIAARSDSYTRWKKALASHLYRTLPLRLWHSKRLKMISRPGETKAEFSMQLQNKLREQRDLMVEKLRRRFAPKLLRLQNRIKAAEQRVEVERGQYKQQKLQTAISIGATVVGALFGRKLANVRSVGRAATAMRGAGRAARERGDISRAEDKVETLRKQLADLERDFEEQVGGLQGTVDVHDHPVDELKVAPRKSDLDVRGVMLVWTPWCISTDGIAEPAFEA